MFNKKGRKLYLFASKWTLIYAPPLEGDYARIKISQLTNYHGGRVLAEIILAGSDVMWNAVALYLSEKITPKFHFNTLASVTGLMIQSQEDIEVLIEVEGGRGVIRPISTSTEPTDPENNFRYIIMSNYDGDEGDMTFLRKGATYHRIAPAFYEITTDRNWIRLSTNFDENDLNSARHGGLEILGGGGIALGDYFILYTRPVKDFTVWAESGEGLAMVGDSAGEFRGGVQWWDVSEGTLIDAFVYHDENGIMYFYTNNEYRFIFENPGYPPDSGDTATTAKIRITPTLAQFNIPIQAQYKSSDGSNGITQTIDINDGDSVTVHHFTFKDGILVGYSTS